MPSTMLHQKSHFDAAMTLFRAFKNTFAVAQSWESKDFVVSFHVGLIVLYI